MAGLGLIVKKWSGIRFVNRYSLLVARSRALFRKYKSILNTRKIRICSALLSHGLGGCLEGKYKNTRPPPPPLPPFLYIIFLYLYTYIYYRAMNCKAQRI